KALFTGMIIPNVFGPFGNPYYNSFIATFSHQLTHGEQPKIDVDKHVKLIYVKELIDVFLREIRSKTRKSILNIPHSYERKVSEILKILECYKVQYFENGIIPELKSSFEINLFNTFRSYIDYKNHFPVKYLNNIDSRGSFAEIIRMNVGGQVSFSTTFPGITRGNHFHTRKIERFSVIKGKALIQLRKIGTSEVLDFYLDGYEPSYIDMPIWYTHNIKNIGEEELYTNFWINEFYDANDPDTYFEEV
ncbi:MAG: epimerase, partial [Chitinophagaceae bacterium]|nr:epimerase [Chitinophagaceae bacterium]